LTVNGDPIIELSGSYYLLSNSTLASGEQVTPETQADVPCLCGGTLVSTERGEVAVETLAIGDRVLTRDGSARPIKWIGRRSYGGRFLMANRTLYPVLFKAGCLGEGLPRRDLRVSRNHAMYLEGVLIPAGALVDGFSVVEDQAAERVEYFHIELDSHDVIFAEGAPTETFLDDDSRNIFHNAHEYHALYPGEADPLVRFCARRVEQGQEIEWARRAMTARAGRFEERADAGPLLGDFDVTPDGRIIGWAQNAAHRDAPVCLDILADGLFLGHVLANKRGAALGPDGHGFMFRTPEDVDAARARIEVRRSHDGAALHAARELAA
jgi:hypothetical protein